MKRIAAIVFCVFLIVSLFPATALAYDPGSGINYNDGEYGKLRDFLNLTSSDGTHTNGWQLNNAYDPLDPVTWGGITWTASTTDRRVQSLSWNSKSLADDLDVSGFTKLTSLNVNENELTGLNVTNAAALRWIYCDSNNISSLSLSTNTALENLSCDDNALTELNTSGAGASLKQLICSDNRIASLVLTGNTNLELLTCNGNALASIDVSVLF